MPRVIIHLVNGIIEGVYSNSPIGFHVLICDSYDKHDDERAMEYVSKRYELKRGGFMDMLYRGGHKAELGTYVPTLDADAFLLVSQQNLAKTEHGQAAQKLETAFVDGYLAASAELSQYLRELYRKQNSDAVEVFDALIPLLDQHSETYEKLCVQLNQPELFDSKLPENQQGAKAQYRVNISEIHHGTALVEASCHDEAIELGKTAIDEGCVHWHNTELDSVTANLE